ncbi:thiol-disulfide oxidoreductase DCC family protein [Paenibacillus sp. GCM10023250]|uniref:thiol-disulfide oxidoreductase DCC family protein n=1 Tax=Paenibacillus sp. GCM10023250 TaxID=3252648 RepID=UPI00361BA106
MKTKRAASHPDIILLIDGDCPLCHWLARFVSKRDAAGRFRFAALDSAAGRRFWAKAGQPGDRAHAFGRPGTIRGDGRSPATGLNRRSRQDSAPADTFVLIAKGHRYVKSGAALRVLRELDGPWPLLYGAILIPAFIRDRAYDFIARRRYRWLGGEGIHCALYDSKLRGRLIEDGEGDEP